MLVCVLVHVNKYFSGTHINKWVDYAIASLKKHLSLYC